VSGAIDGMARAICAAPHDPDDVATSADEAVREYGVQAAAAWAYALGALREPSLAMIHAGYDAGALNPDAMLGWKTMHEAFAAEHGIELPQEPASPEPQG
jgi:hypothetical protein